MTADSASRLVFLLLLRGSMSPYCSKIKCLLLLPLILPALLLDIFVLFSFLDLLVQLSDKVLLHQKELLAYLLLFLRQALDAPVQPLQLLVLPLYPSCLLINGLPGMLPE